MVPTTDYDGTRLVLQDRDRVLIAMNAENMEFWIAVGAESSIDFFFFTDPAPPEIYPLPLHDALPISNDGAADSNLATVSLTITAVNDAPLATAESHATAEDTALTVDAASGLLAHATDIDGDPLTADLDSSPLHATLGLSTDGSFSLTP